jgi:hypothetical protein
VPEAAWEAYGAPHPAEIRECADFYKVFSIADAQLIEERYNLMNAYLATVPGNHARILDFTTGDKDYWIINGFRNQCYLHPAAASFPPGIAGDSHRF